jgi:hypothetical protein
MMAGSYNLGPDVAGSKSFTLRGLLTAALVLGLLVAVQAAAQRYAFEPWVDLAIALISATLGVGIISAGIRDFRAGQEIDEEEAGYRLPYARGTFKAMSPSAVAGLKIALGLLFIANAAFRLIMFTE